MRINRFVAQASGLSRRAADLAVSQGRVVVNGQPAAAGVQIAEGDAVALDGQPLQLPATQTIMLNKPAGYVVSRQGQGSRTIYDLLPTELHSLKPIGRLDKDSSGLLLLTNDGNLAQELTHPSHQKTKVYQIELAEPLQPLHRQMVQDHGVQLDDGPSRFAVERPSQDASKRMPDNDTTWQITMHEGRNRQIRRTFAALGYTVTKLHRTQFGNYHLGNLPSGHYKAAG
jgi:23S rRNA pseudouridine2605 synthase